jgi:hypothetical protein
MLVVDLLCCYASLSFACAGYGSLACLVGFPLICWWWRWWLWSGLFCLVVANPSVSPAMAWFCSQWPWGAESSWSGWLLFLLHGTCMWLRPSIMPLSFNLDGWACSDWPFFVLWMCGRNAFACSYMWLWLRGDPLAGCHCWLRFLTLAVLWTSVSFTSFVSAGCLLFYFCCCSRLILQRLAACFDDHRLGGSSIQFLVVFGLAWLAFGWSLFPVSVISCKISLWLSGCSFVLSFALC